jgi:hypothetical protein
VSDSSPRKSTENHRSAHVICKEGKEEKPWCFNLDSGIFGELMASLGGDAVSLKDIAAMFSSGDEPRMEVLQPEAFEYVPSSWTSLSEFFE